MRFLSMPRRCRCAATPGPGSASRVADPKLHEVHQVAAANQVDAPADEIGMPVKQRRRASSCIEGQGPGDRVLAACLPASLLAELKELERSGLLHFTWLHSLRISLALKRLPRL